MTQTSYTVTGFGDSPLFISMERGSSMVGSGQINGFAILEKDVFTQDYYTQIYLTAADAYDEIAFTDAYTQAVEPVQKRVEALEEERCQARYDEVTKEPRQELNDARKTWQEEKIMLTVSLMMPELSLMMAGRSFQTQRISWPRAEKNTSKIMRQQWNS